MPEGGFYERSRISPMGITIVLLIHGAAITALAMSKMDMPVMKVFKPLPVDHIVIPPDPAPIPEPPKEDVRPKQQIDMPTPIVPPVQRPSTPDVVIKPGPMVPIFDTRPPGGDIAPPADLPKPIPQPPKADLVRSEATMLRSSELQPPYPASEMRAEVEGSVSIRVTIGPNGRVIRAEKISATSNAFYQATERHALRAWRFKPATVDGKPVESTKAITVRFQLND